MGWIPLHYFSRGGGGGGSSPWTPPGSASDLSQYVAASWMGHKTQTLTLQRDHAPSIMAGSSDILKELSHPKNVDLVMSKTFYPKTNDVLLLLEDNVGLVMSKTSYPKTNDVLLLLLLEDNTENKSYQPQQNLFTISTACFVSGSVISDHIR